MKLLSNNFNIDSLKYNDVVKMVMEQQSIDNSTARKYIAGLSFTEYCQLVEANIIAVPPSGNTIAPGASSTTAQNSGKGNLPLQSQLTDLEKNPEDAQAQLLGMVQQNKQSPNTDFEQQQLQRIKQLAGIKENCSAGATSSAAIASVPVAINGVQKRKQTDETVDEIKISKSVLGDTKPNQATGELSSNLVSKREKAANRKNNGFRR